ncbi:MAG: ParB/RepB/Spo0J family partition protein [bacterium]|nr:ParB/RepB/Spo0J family partition protein [Candidatus Sumerlaeota bacterium]
MPQKKRALGKGLDALFPPRADSVATTTVLPCGEAPPFAADILPPDTPVAGERVVQIAIDSLSPNPFQPRHVFNDASLQELAASIRDHGIFQPILVRRRGEMCQIVVGERRWRAARLAGLTSVPVIVRNLSDQEILVHALIENLQRDNLNPMEEARGYRDLIETFGLSQGQVAGQMGKGRPTVANSLRLLKLPDDFQADIEAGRLSAGHARAVLKLESPVEQKRLRDAIVRDGMSVREAEQLALKTANRVPRTRRPAGNPPADPNLLRLRDQIVELFACRAEIKPSGLDRGKIEVYYHSLDELDHILAVMGVETDQND